jgi:hypothetical protein
MASDPAEGEPPHRQHPGSVSGRPSHRSPAPSDCLDEQAVRRTTHLTIWRSCQRLRLRRRQRYRRGREPSSARDCRLFPDPGELARTVGDPAVLQVLAAPTGIPCTGAILGVGPLGLSIDRLSHSKGSAQVKHVHRPTFQMSVVGLKPYSCHAGRIQLKQPGHDIFEVGHLTGVLRRNPLLSSSPPRGLGWAHFQDPCDPVVSHTFHETCQFLRGRDDSAGGSYLFPCAPSTCSGFACL